ncbi:hypothetical protein HY251_03740 [bacterium]|nr:hypothetical protein [bacterium]
MECDGFEAVVVDLLYGELPAERKPEVDAHAAQCPKCGTLARELGEARQLALALPARVTPPRAVDERIAVAARAAAERDVSAFPLRGGSLHVAAAALLVALLSATGFLLGRMTAKPPKVVEPVTSDHWTPPRTPGDMVPNGERGNTPHAGSQDKEPRDPGHRYQEELLSLGKSKLEKKEFSDALTIFRGIYATSGRYPAAIEARLGMAEAYLGLKKFEDADRHARFVRDDVDHFDPTVEQSHRAQTILDRISEERAKQPLETGPH